MAVRFDASLLYEGIWRIKDFAELLNITPKTFSNKKDKWMEIIKKHCDVEEIGLGTYYISNIR